MGQLLISPILDLAECNIYGVDVVESFSGPKKGVEWLRFPTTNDKRWGITKGPSHIRPN